MNPTRPPTKIQTARLLLRPVAPCDVEAVFSGYASSAKATRLMNFPRHTSRADSEGWVERCVRCWESGIAYPFTITLRSTGETIGNIELRLTPPHAEFGYILSERFWGSGYATEAATVIVNWALAQPEISRVWATCHPDNHASARVLTKAGLEFEARLENWAARPQLGERAGPSLSFAKLRSAGVQ